MARLEKSLLNQQLYVNYRSGYFLKMNPAYMDMIDMMGRQKQKIKSKPKPGISGWDRDIIKTPYMFKIIQYDQIDELRQMDSMSSIYNLVSGIIEEAVNIVHKYYKYPPRIIAWLEASFGNVLSRFLYLIKSHIMTKNVEDTYKKIQMTIRLNLLEIYSQLGNSLEIYNVMDNSIRCVYHGYKYKRSINDSINETLRMVDFYCTLNPLTQFPTEFHHHFISAYIAFIHQFMQKDVWNRYIAWSVATARGPIGKIFIESISLQKL